MKLVVLAVLAVVAATSADYHDNVFHFSTLRSPVTVRQPVYQRAPLFQNHYTAEPSAYLSQYTPALPSSSAFFPQYTPATSSAFYKQYDTAAINNYDFSQFAPIASSAVYQAPAQYSPSLFLDYKPALAIQAPIQAPAITYRSSPLSLASPAQYSFGGLYAGSSGSYAPSYNNYRILKQVQEVDPNGPYRSYYATENGITASEEGALVGTAEGPAVAKQGSYSYTAPDGQQVSVNWVADENGFRASGSHLPQA